MKVIKPFTQGLLFRTFEDGGQCHLSVATLGLFPFGGPQALLPEISLWKLVGSELGRNGILDAGMPKPRGEVLVAGRCYAPGGNAVPAARVRLRIGSIDKTLAVFGDRFWRRRLGVFHRISDPRPFTEMDLGYENAFGGSGFKRNPLGKGYAPADGEGGEKVHPLPNVETPRDLIDSPRKRPEPAGFGPLDQTWPQRMKRAGTYDKRWQRERFPGLPEDLDWAFFNAAPEDQQVEGYFEGDDTFAIHGMHPEKAVVEGRLPGIRPRCFLNRKNEEGAVLEEAEMRLDTVWLFPRAERGVAIHRALVEVKDEDAEDVAHLMVAYERLGDDARSFEHYREAFAKRADEDEGYLHLLDERDLIPPGERPGVALLEEEAGSEDEEGVLQENMVRRAAREKEKSREKIRKLGLDPDQYLPEQAPEAPEPNVENLVEIHAFAQKMEAEALARKAEVESRLKEQLAAQGIDYDRFVEQARRSAGGPPKFSAEKHIAQLRAAGLGDAETEEKLRRTEETLRQAYRQHAHRFPPAPPASPEDARRMRGLVQAAHREGRSLSEQDLTGADLSGLDLRGVDMKEALLEGANLGESDLSGADLRGAVLARCDLRGARLVGARMAEACLGEANLEGAHLTDADLSKAAFGKARLSGAELSGATLEGADFMEATLSGVDVSRANLREITFLESDLSGARFVETDVSQCTFLDANLQGVDFTGAKLASTVFVGVKAEKAVFKGADMTKCCAANEASFVEADFEGAELSQAGLRGSDFSGASFAGARMEMADLSECSLKGANLSGVFARQARFEKADLEGADMRSINLFEGSLMKARLVRTDLRGANLYSAECLRAVLEETDLRGANLKMTKIAELVE
jgi:uncharacterized protein YjbI with pentapeptide repeats